MGLLIRDHLDIGSDFMLAAEVAHLLLEIAVRELGKRLVVFDLSQAGLQD
jgi:hypothetical protein